MQKSVEAVNADADDVKHFPFLFCYKLSGPSMLCNNLLISFILHYSLTQFSVDFSIHNYIKIQFNCNIQKKVYAFGHAATIITVQESHEGTFLAQGCWGRVPLTSPGLDV